MDEIVTREKVALLAERAARQQFHTGRAAENPFPPLSDAAAAWEVTLARFTTVMVEGAESSA